MSQGTPPTTNIPAGYVPYQTADGVEFLVPRYLVDIIKLERQAASRSAPGLPWALANNFLNPPVDPSKDTQLGGDVLIPAEPRISRNESDQLYSEITALMAQHGISFKDAAHRLFLAELAVARSEFDALHALSAVGNRIRGTISNNVARPVETIDLIAEGLLKPVPGETLRLHQARE
ncbi:hypothetical protein BDN70DRAFT_939188 [Pholiota conissans]|uniref:Uncharacterized protein n=1 Tax=Pholiota conissans TaxID=109636 RepID=A0A9P5YM67_9AGAR|nr:hypothetical protein BDN70DRAFT_939188 [Pholiota conissans]